MRRMAAELAQQILLGQSFAMPEGLADNPMRIPAGQLYPLPHSPLFDFVASANGAAWIDDFARLALRVRQPVDTTPVLAHLDWCARNVRLGENGLSAVYDMDSLDAVPETTAVGQAAASWRITLDGRDEIHPSIDEVLDYISHYEAARGTPFSDYERAASVAAGVWLIAYTARCEHSTGSEGHSAIPRLRQDGQRFVALLNRFS